ncbi:MAG: ATP-dependent Clp protease ATP-binding subunit, partial [Acidobacteriota bacterium]|nr:ATP-dependent Clp protease ATP-binding subunit [Acidobacteriota bacterium]
SKDETVEILRGLRDRYEAHHRVEIKDEALGAAVELSDRYISGRYLPDKAIDVIDEAGARIRLKAMTRPPDLKDIDGQIEQLNQEKEAAVAEQDFERAAALRDQADKLKKKKETITREWREKSKEIDGVVDEEVIAEVVSKMTGIPLTRLETEETTRLLRMEEEIQKKVISQSEAIRRISEAVRRSRAGLKDPKRPIGTFVFAGPTGVGKTLLAKALAEFMFGDAEALVQIDMSEYMEKHSVSKLIGSPPGYVGHEEGGQLTEKVKRNPYSVVLLDEIEKAHPDIFNILLQVFEDGHLTDGLGNRVNFKNTIIIMTSNIGARFIQKKASLGFQSADAHEISRSVSDMVLGEVKRTFNPEFINRIDEIIVFEALSDDDLRRILGLLVTQLNAHLADRKLQIALTPEALDWIIESTCNGRSYGARPLRRAIQRYIEDPLSEELIRGHLSGGDIEVYLDGGALAYRPAGEVAAGRRLP